MHFVKLNARFLNLDHVTDVLFEEGGEAVVFLDMSEAHVCNDPECEFKGPEQGVRFLCAPSAALLRTYLESVAADPRTPIPAAFMEQAQPDAKGASA